MLRNYLDLKHFFVNSSHGIGGKQQGLYHFSSLILGQNLQHVTLELLTFSILSMAEKLVSPPQLGLGHVPS